jgi:homoserine/homoserine lactone efflux protein
VGGRVGVWLVFHSFSQDHIIFCAKNLSICNALFPQFVDRTHPLFAQFLILGILAICVETVVLIGYAFAAASVRRAVSRQPFRQRMLKGVTGCFFILISLLLGRRTANL